MLDNYCSCCYDCTSSKYKTDVTSVQFVLNSNSIGMSGVVVYVPWKSVKRVVTFLPSMCSKQSPFIITLPSIDNSSQHGQYDRSVIGKEHWRSGHPCVMWSLTRPVFRRFGLIRATPGVSLLGNSQTLSAHRDRSALHQIMVN